VRALPPRQRAVLTLRYGADLTHAEVAQALHCSEEAARRAASDGLKTLRLELADVAAPA
jgi:RNA polymerase sigma factor (sigma-70 family)